jgi:hypothetical protein
MMTAVSPWVEKHTHRHPLGPATSRSELAKTIGNFN